MSPCDRPGCACPMVTRCFEHQHPEAYGRQYPVEGDVPAHLRYGAEHVHAQGDIIPEEVMGNGERGD